jgi:hypothetical protein
VFARAAAQLYDFCAARHRHSDARNYFRAVERVGGTSWTQLSIHIALAWSGLKRYFVEWRKRALIRRERPRPVGGALGSSALSLRTGLLLGASARRQHPALFIVSRRSTINVRLLH